MIGLQGARLRMGVPSPEAGSIERLFWPKTVFLERLLLAVLSPSQQAWIGQRQSLAGVGSYTYVGYASGNIEPKVHDEVG